jgi:hypothetical protein
MITMKRSTLVRWLVLAAIVLLTFVVWRFSGDPHMNTAKRVVRELRAFEYAHNRLPDSLDEIGEKNAGADSVQYQRLDERTFKVRVDLVSGESEVYDSVADQWIRQP